MDFQTMRFFKAIADTGSFTAASEALHYAQSNLSTQIQKLEEELGTKLFYRNKRGVELTSNGIMFYEYASIILRIADEALYAMTDMEHPRGDLRIGSIEAIALNDLPKLIGQYHMDYPDVRLSLKTDLNDYFSSAVLEHKMDGAFVEGSLNHPELKEVFFKKEQLVLVGSGYQSDRDAEDILHSENLITFPEGSSFRRRLEMLLASKNALNYDRLTIINSLGAMISNITAGLGFGYLTRSIAGEYIEKGLMTEYHVQDPFSEFDVVFIYHRDHIKTAAFSRFLELLDSFSA